MPPKLEPHGSISTVDLPDFEHAPRQEAPPPCNGRGTLGSPLTARPGMCSPRHSLAPYPAAHSPVEAQIRQMWQLPSSSQGRKPELFPGHTAKNDPPANVAKCGVLYIGDFRVKLALISLLLSFSSHVRDLLLGNLGNGLRSQAGVGESPAKVTLADLAGLGRSDASRRRPTLLNAKATLQSTDDPCDDEVLGELLSRRIVRQSSGTSERRCARTCLAQALAGVRLIQDRPARQWWRPDENRAHTQPLSTFSERLAQL